MKIMQRFLKDTSVLCNLEEKKYGDHAKFPLA